MNTSAMLVSVEAEQPIDTAPAAQHEIERVEFEVEGGKIEARLVGRGPVTLFIHGILVNGHVWDPLIPLLSGHMRMVLPDFPLGGHRLPLRPDADASLQAHAERVVAIARQLSGPVILVGNDTGGAIAQLAIASAPEMFERLVLLPSDSADNCPPKLLATLRLLPWIPGAVSLIVYALRLDFIVRLLMKTVCRTRLEMHSLNLLLGDLRITGGVRHDLKRLLANLRPGVTLAVERELPRFARPVLIAWTERDHLFPLKYGQRLQGLFPNAKLELISETRTFVSLDQPKRLAQLLSGFLGTV